LKDPQELLNSAAANMDMQQMSAGSWTATLDNTLKKLADVRNRNRRIGKRELARNTYEGTQMDRRA
jgi:hypothetical protein